MSGHGRVLLDENMSIADRAGNARAIVACGRRPRTVYSTPMRSILLIDHGSVRAEANHMLSCAANLLQHMLGESVAVRFAHMELSEPTIAQGFTACVDAGADEVIVFPYMLSPGKHVTRDVPRLVADAARPHPSVTYRMTDAFGVHEKLSELIALRAGLEIANPLGSSDASKCWEPECEIGSCGLACPARAATAAATPTIAP